MMRAVFLALITCVFVTVPARGQTVQQQLDAAESAGGGIVQLPCGTYTNSNAQLIIASGVTLKGTFGCTRVPPIRGKYLTTRMYFIGLEDLIIASNLVSSPYIGVDFRYVTLGYINRVVVECSGSTFFSTAILLAFTAYYNQITHSFGCATGDGIEIYSGANQNNVIGGKFDAPIGINIISSNGTTITGSATETASISNCIAGLTNAGTGVKNHRCESSTAGPWWITQ